MDPRLLQLYNQELQFLREMGGEFARQFSKIAGRLGMQGLEVADPYVERLLEGFAFLAARIQLKLDDQFPRFTQHLLETVYPHYLAPLPSMAVVQLSPNPREGSLGDGATIPRGAALRSLIGKDEQTACEYRTAHEVTLWPLEIAHAEYSSFVGNLESVPAEDRGRARARFSIRLQTTAEQSFESLGLDRLPIFFRGDLELCGRLYEQLLGRVISAWARPSASAGPWRQLGEVAPVGFGEQEALLPYSPRSFQGYRLLHELFAFPYRFMFGELRGLRPALADCPGGALDVMLLLDALDPALEGAVGATHLALHCTPVINLFPRRTDRIHLSDTDHEFHVVPDRTRPMDLEVFSISEVVGHGAREATRQEFLPFYAPERDASSAAYYTLRREPRRPSTAQKTRGPRSSYIGSEVFISLVDGDEGAFRSDLRQLAVKALCTNRDLPLHMPLGQLVTDFTLESGAPVASVRCVAGPTPPRPSRAHGTTAWRLINHLSLNYLSVTDGAALRELLTLYADLGEAASRRQIEAVRSVATSPAIRAIAGETAGIGELGVVRGVQVTLTCDETGFVGPGVFLLGAVLERFFAMYSSINSFTETVLETVQRGEVMRWPARTGQARLL